MQPLNSLDQETARKLRGVLFDIDDTLTDGRKLTELAYGALNRLSEAGLLLIAVTGRPSGYGEVLVPQWPISGLIAENGAIAVLAKNGGLELVDEASAEERSQRTARLNDLAADMQQRFVELRPTTDVRLRRCDFTFDIGEYQMVAPQVVAAAAQYARSRGAATVRSSVHLHISFDSSDKASGALRILNRCFGFDPTLARDVFAFIGDSENDEAAFAAFSTTIGVANLRGRPSIAPKYRAKAPAGQGFAEFAAHLLTLRVGRDVG